MKRSLLLLSLFSLVLCALVSESQAIPAFARKYKISCSTCHAPFPKLKPYGDDFAGDGMILKEQENKRQYVQAGDDLLWLNRDFPVAARFDAYAMYDQDRSVEKDLQTPWGLKLLSGGTLYKNIGFYFYFYMSERGEVAGIEDAYIHFDNVFESGLDVMLGQFQTSDPLMKRELRLTFEDYMIYKQKFGYTGTNLAYDRGVMLVYGIEPTGTDIVTMIVNGNGKAEAENQKFDNDDFKNIGFRITQGIGDILSIGGFYYRGKELFYDEMVGGQGELTNEITYWGPDFNIGIGPFEITGQYLVRSDSKLQAPCQALGDMVCAGGVKTFADKELEAKGIILEAIFSPQLDRSRTYFTALYNRIDHDLDWYDYETATLSGTYLIARNLRAIAEYTRDLHNDKNRFTVGFVSGF
jgi:hypothetical protein